MHGIVKVMEKLPPFTPWRRTGGVYAWLHPFLTYVLDVGELLTLRPPLLAGKEGGLGGPPHSRSGLQKTEKYIAPAPNRTPDRLERSLIPVLITLSMWYTNVKVLVGKEDLRNADGLHTLSERYRHFRQSFLYLWSVVSPQWAVDSQNNWIRSAVITILSVKDR
jgi:hypothetical protein